MGGYNSGWSTFATGRFSPSMLVGRCREILDVMKKRGITVPASNRIERAIRIVDGLNDEARLARASADDLKLGSEAFRSLWEFFYVGYTWRERGRAGGPFTESRLASFFEGSDRAEDDSNSLPRSLQFELYAASGLILGGADVQDGEPDIRFLYHGEYRGVAAKRVSVLTERAVRRAIRDGVRQIRGSTGTGFVALNLDTWLDGLDTANAQSIGASFNAAVEDAHNALDEHSDREALLGAMLYGTRFQWAMDGPGPRIGFHMPRQVRCFTATEADVERSRRFFEPAQERLGNALNHVCSLVSRSAG